MTGFDSKRKAAQDKLEQWDNKAFNNWWDSDYDDSTNPYEKDTFAYWAWAGWQAALAQPAQEPVANDRALQLVTHQLNHWVAYATELRERLNKYEGGAPMLLNITPPHRTWVELTKGEIESWDLPDNLTRVEFAWFVETKLREKNT